MAENQNKWFEYDLLSAICKPISSVVVLKGDKNVVCYATRNEQNVKIKNTLHTIEIDDASFQKLISILNDERLYALNDIEKIYLIDGTNERFYFSNGEKHIELHSVNISYTIGCEAQYPNASIVIEVFRKIKDILVAVGVDEQCFSLS